jgi:hypothetical protein
MMQTVTRPRDEDMTEWAQCLGVAPICEEYRGVLDEAGFADGTTHNSHEVAEGFTSVLVRAHKANG